MRSVALGTALLAIGALGVACSDNDGGSGGSGADNTGNSGAGANGGSGNNGGSGGASQGGHGPGGSGPYVPQPRFDVGAAVASDGRIYVAGGTDNQGVALPTEVYDPTTSTWEAAEPLPQPRCCFFLAPLGDGRLYAVGGYHGPQNQQVGWVTAYDPGTSAWASAADLPEPLGNTRGIAALDRIYVLAGVWGSGAPPAHVPYYDQTDSSWHSAAAGFPIMGERPGVAADPATGYVYVTGGSTMNGPLATVARYDPAQDAWAPDGTVAPMATARSGHMAATAGGAIYVMGGTGSDPTAPLASVERYDAGTNQWTARQPMPTPVWTASAVTGNDGLIYVLFGFDGQKATSVVQIYDPAQDAWQ